MSAPRELHDGDKVLVKATYVSGTVKFASGRGLPLRDVEIATIERQTFSVGNRVIADGHPGEVLAVLGDLLWVLPDSGNRRPWTVDAIECRREPAPKPSAEVIQFQELPTEAMRPSDSGETAA